MRLCVRDQRAQGLLLSQMRDPACDFPGPHLERVSKRMKLRLQQPPVEDVLPAPERRLQFSAYRYRIDIFRFVFDVNSVKTGKRLLKIPILADPISSQRGR